LFFLSGFAALLYQVIWQRILGIFSGVHIYSVMMIVTAFMAGLGFGSLIGGRLADRLTPRRAILAFAGCELLIGAFALISPWLYYDVAYLRLGRLAAYPALLPLIHFSLVLIPTLLMGASLPFIARGVIRDTTGAARNLALLYGLNTLGGGVGALMSVWLLIGRLGFSGTIYFGAVLNFAAAAGVLILTRRAGAAVSDPAGVSGAARPLESARGAIPGPESPAAPTTVSISDPGGSAATSVSRSRGPGLDSVPVSLPEGSGSSWVRWVILYGLSGFIALSLEVLWFRTLDVALKASPYTFGHLLGIFLVVLALGSFAGMAAVERIRRVERAFLFGQWNITLLAAAGLVLLTHAPSGSPLFGQLHSYWYLPDGVDISAVYRGFLQPSAEGSGEITSKFLLVYLFLPVFLLAAPVFLMGFTYPLLQRTVQTSLGQIGWRTGAVQTANIIGSMLGSLITGAFLIGAFGTPLSLRFVLLLGLVFLALGIRRTEPGRRRWLLAGGALAHIILVALLPFPGAFWARLHGMNPGGAIVAEDATGMAAIQIVRPDWVSMRVNGNMHSKVPFGDEHTLLGALPVLSRPEIREAVIVGLGSGNTAWAAGCRPHVERIHVYEIVKPEVDVLRKLDQDAAFPCVRAVLTDPRIRMSFTDGRLALRTDGRLYDMIEADGLEPNMAYSGALYSREFFELCRSRLKTGGILCTYVPTERTRRTVVQVFPYVLDFHSPHFASFIIAGNEPIVFEPDSVRARLHEPWTQEYFADAGLGPESTRLIDQFLDTMTVTRIEGAGREAYARGDHNSDLFPRDEFDRNYTGDYQ